jgi:hypothetical protein
MDRPAGSCWQKLLAGAHSNCRGPGTDQHGHCLCFAQVGFDLTDKPRYCCWLINLPTTVNMVLSSVRLDAWMSRERSCSSGQDRPHRERRSWPWGTPLLPLHRGVAHA